MSKINIIKVSSKGQIVIPQEMREDIKEGDKLIVIQNDNQIILKKTEHFDKNIEEDLEFAKRTREAWKEIEEGKCTRLEFDDFIKEIRKW
ncbi:MAG: AbrB/MazE/SpoVT family DNA-binding domain-containing protein [Candidatus Pacearchaeota archaeon]|jgi:AbrB family looped-hinge helix DNA binding protein